MRPDSGATPSVLLFDFGGTLDSDGIPWKERFSRLFAEEGVRVSPEVFDAAFYAADDALVGKIPPGVFLEGTVERLAHGVAGQLAGAAAAAPGDGSGASVAPGIAARVAARFVSESLTYLSKNAALLARLHGRYALGVVSNFYGNLEAVCREAGLALHLGAIVDSAAVGYQKPDRRIFLAALSELDAEPSEAVFVGDSMARDMAGARELGMPHIWLAARDGAGCCPGDRVIHRLAELPEILL